MNPTTEPRKHVLVVEDDADYSALLSVILENQGLAVSTAYDGEEALEQVLLRRPDLVTLDLQMPRKSGTLFYRQMKQRPELRDVPVIVLTGLTRDSRETETVVRSLLETEHLPAPDAYLEKPSSRREIAETVDEVLRRSP